jgi:hypothetical protein
MFGFRSPDDENRAHREHGAGKLVGREFSVARIAISGFGSMGASTTTGAGYTASLDGDMLVDQRSGLVLYLNVKSRSPLCSIRREITRIASI